MTGFKINCILNGDYSFLDYVDHKKDGKLRKALKNKMNHYYTKRVRRFINKTTENG